MKNLVLIPGWATDKRIFSNIDLPCDPILLSSIDPDKVIPELIDVLDKKNIRKVSVAGWSLGGNIAAEFASKYPERVESLVLLSVRSSYEKDAIKKIKDIISENQKAYLYKFYLECFSDSEKEDLKWFKDNLMKGYFDLFPRDILIKGLDWLCERPIIPEKIKNADVTFIFGKLDRIVPALEVIKLKNMFSRARFVLADRAGHIPFLKDRGQLIRHCLDDY